MACGSEIGQLDDVIAERLPSRLEEEVAITHRRCEGVHDIRQAFVLQNAHGSEPWPHFKHHP